jgi:hypothetical protein
MAAVHRRRCDVDDDWIVHVDLDESLARHKGGGAELAGRPVDVGRGAVMRRPDQGAIQGWWPPHGAGAKPDASTCAGEAGQPGPPSRRFTKRGRPPPAPPPTAVTDTDIVGKRRAWRTGQAPVKRQMRTARPPALPETAWQASKRIYATSRDSGPTPLDEPKVAPGRADPRPRGHGHPNIAPDYRVGTRPGPPARGTVRRRSDFGA